MRYIITVEKDRKNKNAKRSMEESTGFEQPKRFDTRSNLARKFVVSMRTVQRDIEEIPYAFLIYMAIKIFNSRC